MDYKEKYNKLVEAVKVLQETNPSDEGIQNWVNDNVPELAESRDEKVRKWIYNYFRSCLPTWIHPDITCGEILDWLEKQGEPKEYTFKSLPRLLDMIEPTSRVKAYCQKLIDTLAKEGYNTDAKIVEEVLKGWNGDDVPMAIMDEQKPTWSKEDEKMKDLIISVLEVNHSKGIFKAGLRAIRTEEIVSWLKSLKQRYTWKPSEEQMKALHDMNLTGNISYAGQGQTLIELYNDLKKL